jgi:iron complex transport system ATP-binding protein
MIEAHNISLSINGHQLLNQVSMQLRPGCFSAVLGKNGAGKSTFLKTLTGELKPDAGEIRLDGQPLSAWPLQELARRRAVMMQQLQLSFGFTAFEVVMLGRMPHSNGFESAGDREIVRECMQQAGVGHLEQRSFPTLSGGEKQRVQFARMLAQLWNHVQAKKPCILLLDEPLASLDLAHQHAMMRLVHRLSRKNVAVMMILHDLNLAAQYADEINIMKDGRSFALGTPQEIFKADIIHEAFDCPVHIMQHPQHNCPLVIASLHEETTGEWPSFQAS